MRVTASNGPRGRRYVAEPSWSRISPQANLGHPDMAPCRLPRSAADGSSLGDRASTPRISTHPNRGVMLSREPPATAPPQCDRGGEVRTARVKHGPGFDQAQVSTA